MKNGDSIEISPRSLILMNSLSEMINKLNGGMLIIDYGENQSLSNSVRVNLFPKKLVNFDYRLSKTINFLMKKSC